MVSFYLWLQSTNDYRALKVVLNKKYTHVNKRKYLTSAVGEIN